MLAVVFGGRIAVTVLMRAQIGRRLGRIVVLPFATIGVTSALLVWEIEHVGSIALALFLAAAAAAVCIVVARRVRRQIDELAEYYEALLRTADDESRRAEAAGRIKDEFLSTLSHELRTPLNSVLGWSRLLASGKLDASQSAKAIQAIERAGWAQSRLIEDLLDISRIVGGRLQISPRPTLLQPIITFVVQSLEPAAVAKGITVRTELDPGIGLIAVDPDRLQQIAWHLVSNAIKFTPAEGHVTVALALCNQQVCLTVSDSGVGFTPEHAPLLFERFRQGDSSTTRPFGGIGLGLGMVRHLVEMHGGTVSAHSAGINQGATFEVQLPLRTAPIESPRPSEETPFLQGVSVLVVDDDSGELELARSSLTQFGASVATATSAEEARALLRSDPPDVLLSDLRMPGTDGLQFIREVRELDAARGRHTPAAALTALVRAADRQVALEAGYEMHVAKPIDPFELAVAVEQLVKDE
jgi:signal transduction histidine kinase/CheY-like chemotaxis protein